MKESHTMTINYPNMIYRFILNEIGFWKFKDFTKNSICSPSPRASSSNNRSLLDSINCFSCTVPRNSSLSMVVELVLLLEYQDIKLRDFWTPFGGWTWMPIPNPKWVFRLPQPTIVSRMIRIRKVFKKDRWDMNLKNG